MNTQTVPATSFVPSLSSEFPIMSSIVSCYSCKINEVTFIIYIKLKILLKARISCNGCTFTRSLNRTPSTLTLIHYSVVKCYRTLWHISTTNRSLLPPKTTAQRGDVILHQLVRPFSKRAVVTLKPTGSQKLNCSILLRTFTARLCVMSVSIWSKNVLNALPLDTM